MKNITIRLSEKTIAELKKLADKDKRTLSAYIRKILEEQTQCH